MTTQHLRLYPRTYLKQLSRWVISPYRRLVFSSWKLCSRSFGKCHILTMCQRGRDPDCNLDSLYLHLWPWAGKLSRTAFVYLTPMCSSASLCCRHSLRV
jgi:hypothetical protein